MAKTRKLTILVEDDLYDAIKAKSDETGIPFSVVARRALERWVVAGETPPVTHRTEEDNQEET